VELRDVVVPERLHREHVLARVVAAAGEVDTVVLDLVLVPAEPDPEREPSVGDEIQRGDGLGGDDRFALGDHADAGAEADTGRHGRGGAQRDERVQRSFVLLGQLRGARRRGSAPAGRDVGVFGDVQGCEFPFLGRAGQLDDRHRLVRGEHRDPELHAATVPDLVS
jgi:hypothetical protein